MTTSEVLFERFCTEGHLSFRRIDTDVEKTPDYEVVLGNVPVIVEVKEFTLNESDKEALHDCESGGSAVWGMPKLGSRVRNKIESAKHQLECLASGRCPGLLLLYDGRPSPIGGIFPYEILVAMYGFETIDVHVSEKPEEPVRFGRHKFGKGGKLRYKTHTYISAVGILREVDGNRLHIDLYHNIFADNPLPLEPIVGRADMSLFSVPSGSGNEFREWVQVVSAEEYERTHQLPKPVPGFTPGALPPRP